jgi:hypothetical protein
VVAIGGYKVAGDERMQSQSTIYKRRLVASEA